MSKQRRDILLKWCSKEWPKKYITNGFGIGLPTTYLIHIYLGNQRCYFSYQNMNIKRINQIPMCYTDSRNHLWPNTTYYIGILTTISNTNKYKQIWVALVISCTIFCLLVILTSWISFDKMCLVTRTIAVNSSVIDRWIVQMWKLSVLIIWTLKIMDLKSKKRILLDLFQFVLDRKITFM